ncbi:MAG: methyltransferase domain-containing protein [Chloroflexi bacterium]|nr:methyltransferase domain-containing protein [Chloroflexota bacterium]
MAYETRNILINKIHDRELGKQAPRYLGGRLVDVGCGMKPYKKMLSPFVVQHIGVDHKETLHYNGDIDLWSTAYNMPLCDASFDSALCTAVLEHLEEPESALRECYRVLKSGGHAIYSIPFIWHLHEEPRDYYRFSKYGITYLFNKVGFSVVEIKALSGFWVTFGQLLVYNIYRLNRGPFRWFRVIDFAGLMLQFIFYIMDKIDKTEQWTWMYMVVAKKP